MPASVNRFYTWSGAAAQYITVGPVPPDSVILSINVLLTCSAAGHMTVYPGIGKARATDAATLARTQKLIHVSSTIADDTNALGMWVPNNNQGYVSINTHYRLTSGAAYVHLRLQTNNVNADCAAFLEVLFATRLEYTALYSDRRTVSLISPGTHTVTPAGPMAPATTPTPL